MGKSFTLYIVTEYAQVPITQKSNFHSCLKNKLSSRIFVTKKQSDKDKQENKHMIEI